MSDPSAVLALEPDDLDGHTVDELDDYLERGRTPADPSIDASPACQIALSALQRLHDVAGAYLDDADAAPAGSDQDWISAVLTAIPLDARAGRRFVLPAPAEGVVATVTEGAVRGLVRAVGDEVPGLLVGSVRLRSHDGDGDAEQAAVARLAVEVALVHGTPLAAAVAALRQELLRLLPEHVPFAVEIIDVTVVGLIEPTSGGVR